MTTFSNEPLAANGVGDFFTDLYDAGGSVLGNLWGKTEETANKIAESAPDIIAQKAEEYISGGLSPDKSPLPTNPTNSPAVGATVKVNGNTTPTTTTEQKDILAYAEMPVVAGGLAAGGAKLAGMSWLNSILIGAGAAIAVPYVIKNYAR